MDKKISIKKVLPGDFEALKTFMLIALKEDPLAFSVNYEEYAFNSEEWWRSYLSAFLYGYNTAFLIARDEDKIVGMIGVMYQKGLRRNHLATIVWFYVDKAYRGKKIGKSLMDSILDEVKQQKNIVKISLMMNVPQKNALSIYEKYGFKIVGTLEKEMRIGNQFFDEYIMELLIQ
jgi:ribosomal protein S18 acetylase RimI-like enzyme